jgi:hypothetical protein
MCNRLATAAGARLGARRDADRYSCTRFYQGRRRRVTWKVQHWLSVEANRLLFDTGQAGHCYALVRVEGGVDERR